jgi:hypothetical protein
MSAVVLAALKMRAWEHRASLTSSVPADLDEVCARRLSLRVDRTRDIWAAFEHG